MFKPREFHYEYTSKEAQALREQLFSLRCKLEEETALRESKQGQAKRPHTAQIKVLIKEVDGIKELLKLCPPEPITDGEALADVCAYFQKYVDGFEKAKAKFLEQFAQNPAATIEWKAIAIVVGQEQERQAKGLINYTIDHTFAEWWGFFCERYESWFLDLTYHTNVSVSGVNWRIEDAGKTEAKRQLIRDLEFRILSFERLNEAVKAGNGEI